MGLSLAVEQHLQDAGLIGFYDGNDGPWKKLAKTRGSTPVPQHSIDRHVLGYFVDLSAMLIQTYWTKVQ
jgi:hypothetical protein